MKDLEASIGETENATFTPHTPRRKPTVSATTASTATSKLSHDEVVLAVYSEALVNFTVR